MQSRTLLLGLLLLSLTCVISCQWGEKRTKQSVVPAAPIAALFAPLAPEQALDLATPPAIAANDPELWTATLSAYARNANRPLWFAHGKPRPQIQGLRDAIRNSFQDGLDLNRYEPLTIDRLALLDAGAELPLAEVNEADLTLSFIAIRFARDLQLGMLTPDARDRQWAAATAIDHGALIYQASRSDAVEQSLRSLAPQHPQYQLLRGALADYRELARHVAWPMVPEKAKIKPGKSGSEIPLIRARMIASGHLKPDAVVAASTPVLAADFVGPPAPSVVTVESVASSETLDEPLMDAIKQFQREHALEDDGIPGTETLAAMNVPLNERVRQLEINLERWRWLPEQLGDTHVLVNVPTFQLTAVQDRSTALEMRVITGTRRTPTPIFHSAIQTVVLSPYWNVPPSILRGEIRPGVAKDPGYLKRKNMEVLRNGQPVDLATVSLSDPGVRVRQRPGAGNSLGHVKFMFPNEHNVYLHDTPSDSLFARAERSLSHGCVRLERPFEMARWVLRNNPEWDDVSIQAAMDSGREKHVKLPSHIPVYVLYQTTWVNDDGTLVFAKDLYGHDQRQVQALPVTAPDTMYAQEVAAVE